MTLTRYYRAPVLALLFAAAAPCSSILYTATGSNGNLSASVQFSFAAQSMLVLRIENTAAVTSAVPADVLIGVFFNLADGITLTPYGAAFSPGSYFVNGIAPESGIGANWGYASDFLYMGANQGVSAVGLGLFGAGSFGCGPGNPCEHTGGLDYGLAPAVYPLGFENKGVTKPLLIEKGVDLVFSNVPQDVQVTSVWFQYGTDLREPGFYGEGGDPQGAVPEPAAMLLTGAGLVGVGLIGYRRRTLK